MKINEIEYASGVDSTVTRYLHPDNATRVATVDHHPVFRQELQNGTAYFIYTDKLLCYVLLGDKRDDFSIFKQLEKFTNISGIATALIICITKKLGIKLMIADSGQDSLLTHSGLNWLIKSIKNPRGLVITDQKGKTPDVKELYSEWGNSRTEHTSGKTSIYIESKDGATYDGLFEDESHLIIKTMYRYIGDTELE